MASKEKTKRVLSEHIVEIVSDSGEGAQKAGVSFAQISARMGNGLWTVEIIPSEIQPPTHTVAAASGNRIRLSEKQLVTNPGDQLDLIVAFNELALLSRVQQNALKDDAIVLIDSRWAKDDNPQIRKDYKEILGSLEKKGASIVEVPIEKETSKIVEETKKGMNMFVVGLLCSIYCRDPNIMETVIETTFAKKAQFIIDNNIKLARAGFEYGEENLDFHFEIPSTPSDTTMVAMNGNTAVALGTIAAGFKLCSMYPITPATSASHVLSDIYEDFGGYVHQAEDEIAAIGVALGSYYAGVPAVTITSGPGMALKTEFQGLTVMTETPLVIVNVQRGGPSTGLPTKIEQGDLLSSIYGTPGDAPKVVLAASTIEECYHIMITARKIADEFRMLVIILSDANLATGQQLFPQPVVTEDSLPAPMDQSPVPQGTEPFGWDPKTGISKLLIPGQPGGMNVTTGLNHASNGKIVYDYASNQMGHRMRSRKLAALQSVLEPPEVVGDESADLLLVGWGSTRGTIEEAVERAREHGLSVSSVHITFLSPLPSGLKSIFSKFKKVMTIELNYSDDMDDPLITAENRRYSQLAMLLRANTLVDVDCFSRVPGRPFMPKEIENVIKIELNKLSNKGAAVQSQNESLAEGTAE
ncbi:MAG: 2-oxoacid:acceptor oxidoreductase subunit alpha [Gammaproteobacteria bacterium]|nr:2-oxoacid:acceptor oxidoreductase subunit alpha [Gammaproteobacteria bacterium]